MDKKISELNPSVAINAEDLLVMVQNGATLKVPVSLFMGLTVSKTKTIVFGDFSADKVTVSDYRIKTIKSLNIRGIGPLIPVVDYEVLISGGFKILYAGFEAQADTAISIHYTEI